MKTFAFILYLLAADGSEQAYVLDSGLTAEDCAARLVHIQVDPRAAAFYEAMQAIAACEEETEV
jgi:hypothetical protein